MIVSERIRKEYNEAVAYLCTSVHGAELVTAFERTNATLKAAQECDRYTGAGSWFDPNTQTIYWDVYDAVVLEEGVASPSMGLAHEMVHAVECQHYGQLCRFVPRWMVEDSAARAEAVIERELGEPVRHGYTDGVGFPMKDKLPITGYRTL